MLFNIRLVTSLVLVKVLIFSFSINAQYLDRTNFSTSPITLVDFKNAFNGDNGKVRLVILFSPTWGQCISGAGAVQQDILEKISSDDLQIYVIWQRVLSNDTLESAQKAAKMLFNDGRVQHMWDPFHTMGLWYKGAGDLEHKDPLVWDAYYLYASDASWMENPTGLIDAGSTVWELKERLTESVTSIISK